MNNFIANETKYEVLFGSGQCMDLSNPPKSHSLMLVNNGGKDCIILTTWINRNEFLTFTRRFRRH